MDDLDCPEKITKLVGTDMLMIKNLIHIFTIHLGVTSKAEYHGVILTLHPFVLLNLDVAKKLVDSLLQET